MFRWLIKKYKRWRFYVAYVKLAEADGVIFRRYWLAYIGTDFTLGKSYDEAVSKFAHLFGLHNPNVIQVWRARKGAEIGYGYTKAKAVFMMQRHGYDNVD